MIRIAKSVTNLCLLLAVVLTAFLLSGTTSPPPAISNLHFLKIELNSTRVATATETPTGTSALPTAEIYTGSTTQRATATRVAESTTSIKSTTSKTSVDSVPKQQTTFNPPSAAATKAAVRRNSDDGYPDSIFQRYRSQIDYGVGQLENDRKTLGPRAYSTGGAGSLAPGVGEEIHSNEGATVLIGYFGVCAKNNSAPYSCAKSRRGVDRLEGATPELLRLAASIQGAISPLPPIIALIFQGMFMCLAYFTGFRSDTDLNTRLGQVLALLAFAAFSLSLFTAILFQSASAVAYGALSTSDTLIASKGSSGIALAWAAVLFTSLSMAGVILLLLTGGFKQKAKGYTKELELVSRLFGHGGEEPQQDIESPPPVHRGHSNTSRRLRSDLPLEKSNYF